MSISKFKIGLVALGGLINPFGSAIGSVISYILEIVRAAGNAAMGAIPSEKKAKIAQWLDVAKTALAWCYKLQPYVPVKWQVQYKETVEALETLVDALSDFDITKKEMEKIEKEFTEAYEAWEKED